MGGERMKKEYVAVELTFIEFEALNVLSASNNLLPDEENPF